MTAPSLILLAPGDGDPRTAAVSRQVRDDLRALRPELDVVTAFTDAGGPSASSVAGSLVRRGVREAVIVPLLLADAFPTGDAGALASATSAAHPDLSVLASRPIGPEAPLLSVVDRRLRDALRVRRVNELDGLVLSAEGSPDVRSNALVARRARQWATHHRLPCVTAFASGSGPSSAEAVRTLRAQGRRHIAVGSWFLAPGDGFRRQADAALVAGAVAVSDPLGAGPEIAEIALARYVVTAIELVDLDSVAETEELPQRHLSVVPA